MDKEKQLRRFESFYKNSNRPKVSNASNAEMGRRISAVFIDFGLAAVIQAVLMFLFIILPMIQNQIDSSEALSRNFAVTSIASLYMLLRDCLKGRSVGKRIMKLSVVPADNDRMPLTARLFIRNVLIVIWPVEVALLLSGNQRLGDRIAGTRVVECSKSNGPEFFHNSKG